MAATKYDEEMVKRAEEFAAAGRTDAAIAAMLGISRASFYNYCREHPELEEAVTRGRGYLGNMLETRLLDMALGRVKVTTVITDSEDRETIKERMLGPNLSALKLLLKRFGGEEWREVLRPERTSADAASTDSDGAPLPPFGSPEAKERDRRIAFEAIMEDYRGATEEEKRNSMYADWLFSPEAKEWEEAHRDDPPPDDDDNNDDNANNDRSDAETASSSDGDHENSPVQTVSKMSKMSSQSMSEMPESVPCPRQQNSTVPSARLDLSQGNG